jgi:hypothetical protein
MSRKDRPRAAWRKSSFSNADRNCVEVSMLDDAVAVRDSKDPAGPVLVFTPTEWDAFTRGVVDGQFDR